MTALEEMEARLRERFGQGFVAVSPLLGAHGGNQIEGAIGAPSAEDIAVLPAEGTAERRAMYEVGALALSRGEVGVVVLAGGMATRFGGAVKALSPALGALSFLDLKRRDVVLASKVAGRPVPLYLMTSFSTDGPIREALARLGDAEQPVECFRQHVALRVTPDGEPFLDGRGEPSLYAPGHGDLPAALRESGVLERFRRGGGKYLFVTNVDNLVATLDPAVLGAHVRSGRPLSVEVVEKNPGDVGGAPAWVDGVLQIVEAFRFPEGFDQSTIPVFNTNTFVMNSDALERAFPLTLFRVEKKVEGRPCIQFERLVGQLTAFLPTAFLKVPRTGDGTRFLPAKDPAELAARQPDMERALRARGVIDGD